MNDNRVIVPLDVSSLKQAKPLIKMLAPYVAGFKIGLQLLVTEGAPKVVKAITSMGSKAFIFFDGKYHDIPNTVKGASKATSDMGVWAFNVHASAGIDAMYEAVDNKGSSLVWAVTVLTSLEENEAHLIYGKPSKASVLLFARYAKLAGCDGVICSPQELAILTRRRELRGMQFVTPGIRPEWADANDQNRTMTPGEAVHDGATYVVIGRPVTDPPAKIGSPVDAIKLINAEIVNVLENWPER